jgi:hypothetical protein
VESVKSVVNCPKCRGSANLTVAFKLDYTDQTDVLKRLIEN